MAKKKSSSKAVRDLPSKKSADKVKGGMVGPPAY